VRRILQIQKDQFFYLEQYEAFTGDFDFILFIHEINN
jgi:hypothetical protein